MSKDLTHLTATELRQAFDSNQFTIEHYVTRLLEHIEKRDPIVKAWAWLDRKHALQQARKLDQIPKDQRGPLHGIPIGIKDVIQTHDMPTQYNSPILTDHQPGCDAASVHLLRHHGALLLGKTATTEFAASSVGPTTTNPHNPEHSPGGSSSGSAAAVADFQVPLAIGTQTGGSIVRPASFNGIFGFKPTWNAVSVEGQKTFSINLDTIGFFARSVEDLQLLSSALGIRDDARPRELQHGIRSEKIAVLKTDNWHVAESSTRTALQRTADALREAGAQVEETALPAEFKDLVKWQQIIMKKEGGVAHQWTYHTAKDKLDPRLQDFVEKSASHADYLTAIDGIASLKPHWDRLARQYAAVVTPSVPGEAPKGLGWTGDMIFNVMWTALQVPAINVPVLEGNNGLPVGITLVAARYQDEALLGVARHAADAMNRSPTK